MAGTVEDKLRLLEQSKKDIYNAIRNKLGEISKTIPKDTPLSEYDVYIKMIQGGSLRSVDTYEELLEIEDPEDKTLCAVYNKEENKDFQGLYIYNKDLSHWENVPNVYTARAKDIAPGYTALGKDGAVVGEFTTDATATADDILGPKTAYVNGEKVEGGIQVESIIDSDILATPNITIEPYITDYRKDLGLAIAPNGRTIRIYKIEENGSVLNSGLIKTIELESTLFAVSYNSASTTIGTTRDAKFLINNDNSDTGYIVIAGRDGFDGGGNYGHNWGYATVIVKIDYNTLDVLNTFKHNWVKHWGENVYGNPYGNGGIKILPLKGNRYVAMAVGANFRNGGGDIGTRYALININTDTDTTTAIEFSGASFWQEGNGYASENGRYVMSTNGSSIVITLFNAAFTSAINKFSGSDAGSYKPVLMGEHLYYKQQLFDKDGNLIKTFTTSPFESEASYKFYSFNYVLEFIDGRAYIYKYNSVTYTFEFIRMYTEGGVITFSPAYATGDVKYFPVATEHGALAYNQSVGKSYSYNATSSDVKITSMRRKGYYYPLLDGTNATSDKLLIGYKAFSGDTLMSGSMANNGAKIITPTEQTQTFPKGFYESITVNPDTFEGHAEYEQCLTLSEEILS